MSGALEKWRGNVPAKLENKIEKWRQRREAEGTLQVQRASRTVEPRRAAPPVVPGATGEVVWLPRVCALHGEGWIAAYIRGANGRFSLVETIRMTNALWRQYEETTAARVVDVGDRGNEECPWCGATCRGWGGPVSCSRCHAKVCFGRTTSDNYFRCHARCGGEGKLMPTSAQEFGFTPSLQMQRRGGNAGG